MYCQYWVARFYVHVHDCHRILCQLKNIVLPPLSLVLR